MKKKTFFLKIIYHFWSWRDFTKKYIVVRWNSIHVLFNGHETCFICFLHHHHLNTLKKIPILIKTQQKKLPALQFSTQLKIKRLDVKINEQFMFCIILKRNIYFQIKIFWKLWYLNIITLTTKQLYLRKKWKLLMVMQTAVNIHEIWSSDYLINKNTAILHLNLFDIWAKEKVACIIDLFHD